MPRIPRNPGTGKPPHNGSSTGAGWGGSAKGSGKPAGQHGNKAAAGRAAPGEGKRARAQALLESAAEQAAKTVIDIAKDSADPRALAAAESILRRTLGDPKQTLDVTLRNVPADEMTDDELAAIAARGRRGAAGAEGDQD